MKRGFLKIFYLMAIASIFSACEKKEKKEEVVAEAPKAEASVSKEAYGATQDGIDVDLYTLENANGMVVKVTNYGGIITSILTPDKSGEFGEITLGFDSVADYENYSPYFGALIGRYGNRIANGKFSLDGVDYELVQNNGKNHLHGGTKGFDKVVWAAEEFKTEEGAGLTLTYLSKDMEEGYPGNLNVEVLYFLTNSDELEVTYKATTDKKTIVNLTQHAYFNFTDNAKTDILDHEVMIASDKLVPVDETLIPTGELTSVEGTPFDFNIPIKIGEKIEEENEQLKYGLGYDHCFVLKKEKQDSLELAATVYDPESGRFMELYTTEPAIQFYSGNFLDGSFVGRGGVSYNFRDALCLEPEHYPDSPNQSDFPSTVLNPGEEYYTKTVYSFSVK
ncbi:aldose epimerase family protein [Flammeovirgaceae bacterium SG7u.111]|nr:aldose epimerase family protein [Flammeovirgaceae bacterium SG7u.132]WPO33021.1 aldose epimerase family protein [Flammeovirgaceae bacterium SG7u.111]